MTMRAHHFSSISRANIPALLFLLLVSPVLPASDDAAWLRDQLRQTTVELRRLQDENGALQQRLQKAGTVAAPVPAPADGAAKAEARRARAEAERLQTENSRLQAELAAANERNAGLQQTLLPLQQQLQAAEQARAELASAAAAAAQCESDNAELAKLGLEVVARYRDRGFLDVLRGAEPLTGVARARHETLAEKYRAGMVKATRAGVPAVDAAADNTNH
jgi:DNA repair exonuclease SbcCD ATPase subunit